MPLFESGETLANSGETIRTLLDTPVYRAALDAVGEQEIMVGYSDSNKDVGYTASGWHVYRAQLEMAAVMREHGVAWQFFHGRGGAVGRGGGPSYTAVRAQPAGTVAGRLKVTEQGEMLSAKFSLREIAYRELELTTSAALVTTLDRSAGRAARAPEALRGGRRRDGRRSRRPPTAASSTATSDFADFFHAATPVREVSRLQLGSRPARRKATRGSRTSARSPGSSPGRSRARSCRPGSASARRFRTRASATASSCCARWSATGRSSRR